MAPHERQRTGSVYGCLVVLGVSALLVGAVTVGMDAYCTARFYTNRPVYPNAEVLEERTPFLAMKTLVLYSPDYSVDIRTWYNVDAGMADRTNPDRWQGRLLLQPARDRDEGGNYIYMYVPCPSF